MDERSNQLGDNQSEVRTNEAESADEVDHAEHTDTEQLSNEAAANRRGGGKGWKIATAALAVLLAGSLIWQPLANKEKAVAVVNSVKIGEHALYDELVKLGGESVLSSMIAQETIRQGIEAAGVSVTDAEVEAEMGEVIDSYGSKETFLMLLDQYGYTEETFRSQIETQLKIEKIVAGDVNVTDDDIAEYFEAYQSSFDKPEQVRASHILVETKEEAEQLLEQLKAGGDFAQLASEHSLDNSNKDNGGDLDFFERGMMEEGFETAAFTLAVGEMGIAETSYGFHVVKVTDKQAAEKATLENSKDEIRRMLEDEQLNTLVNTWISDQQANAKIENKLAPAEETTVQSTGSTSDELTE